MANRAFSDSMDMVFELMERSFLGKILYSFSRRWDKARAKALSRGLASVGEGFSISKPWIVMHPEKIKIGKNFSALYNLRLEAHTEYEGEHFSPEINIGDDVHLNSDCHIGAINRVDIGDNVLMASRIFISDHLHGCTDGRDMNLPPVKRKLISKGPVAIGRNVWIGEGVTVLSGVMIGDNSIIGANAVVTRSFPPNSVLAGNPARLVRTMKAGGDE